MFDPEDVYKPVNDKAESDRVNGEYHYSNGYTERIYSDAHYVRADESTTPPRYYTPPEKTARQSREEKSRKGVGAGALIACCLVCAMLGGIGGAFLTGRVMEQKVSALEQSVDELSESVRQPTVIKQSTGGSAGSVTATGAAYNGAMSAGDLYDMACEQVVGVSTEVTYMNYFGMRSSAAVSGTGFIITADGYILTNYHVIEDAYKAGLDVNVMMHDGTRYPAQIVGVEGIGFAIPISDAVSIAQDLVTSGYVTGKAHLGVSVNSKYNEMYAQYYGWPVGAYIDSVDSGSSAENAGIQPGDIITAIDGDAIRSYDDLRASVKRHAAGETVDVVLYRADENYTVSVTFDEERPA